MQEEKERWEKYAWGGGDSVRGIKERKKTKMSGLYREEALVEGQPSPWAGKFRVGGRVCQVGTERCWENLQARSALMCKTCT